MRHGALLVPVILVVGLVLGGLLMSRQSADPGIHLEAALLPPSWEHPFGLDEEGRDVMRRVVIGARLSLLVSAGVVILTTVVGLLVGGFAGLVGGRVDHLFILVTDGLLAFPGILLVIALVAVQRESGVWGLVGILSLLGWVTIARLVRGEVLALKGRPFVEAAVSLGISSPRLLLHHLVPNLVGPLAVQAAFQTAGVILTESTLSFLGIGFPSGTPSWGGLIDQGVQFFLIAPHLVIFPGLALTLTILSLNLLGDHWGDRWSKR